MSQTPPPPATPPMTPGAMTGPPRTSTWPGTLGIIAIVFGVLASLGSVCGMVGQFTMFSPFDFLGIAGMSDVTAAVEDYRWLNVTVIVLQLLLGVLLIVAGATMVGRRAKCRPLALVWAYAKLIVVIMSSVAGYFTQLAMMDAMMQQPGTMPMYQVQLIFGLVFGLLWGWALPIFMIFWLNRRKVRDEIAGWS